MKNRISRILILTLLSTTFMLSSCENSDDGPVVLDRDKFLGLWKATSTGPGGSVNFNINITASNSDEDQIIMENFDALGMGTYVGGNVTANTVFIPTNLVNADTISGTGLYHSGNTLSFDYEVRDGQTVENRTATARR
ncbi:MAG: hypothetical protein KA444_05000 [Bacteroidia bacterium]|nr:hypothetical protein [Bacteroidia bacterium]